MRFIKVTNFEIMRVGKTQNTLKITKSAIQKCMKLYGFNNAPIVFNNNQEFKDYRDNDTVDNFQREKCIGVIIGDIVFDELSGSVFASVMLQEEFRSRKHFDNWQIDYDKEDDDFKYCACELFSPEES